MKEFFITVIAALFVFPVMSIAETATGTLTLVKNGKPEASIVIAGKPTKSAQLGAYELQRHIKLISGANLPIVNDEKKASGIKIFVGESEAVKKLGLKNGDFKKQEYTIRFVPGAIVLIGKDKTDYGKVTYDMSEPARISGLPHCFDETGTLYAVYDFLERFCKVRWIAPNELSTVYPETKTLTVNGKDIRRRPFFIYREATRGYPGNYDKRTQLWGRFFFKSSTPESEKKFKEWLQLAYPELHKKYKGRALKAAHNNLSHLYLLRSRNGGKRQQLNHSFYGYYNRYWEKSKNPIAAKLFIKKRPEMFAKKVKPNRHGQPPQMCYTNPEFIEQVVQDAKDYCDGRKTGADLGIFWRPALPVPFPLATMDNVSYCKCPECSKFYKKGKSKFFSNGDYSEYVFTFANKIAEKLHKTHPGAKLATYAYASTTELPEGFKLDPKIDVHFCFASNRSSYGRLSYLHELKLLEEWVEESKISKRNLYLYLYYIFPQYYGMRRKFYSFPGFFAHTIDKQFKLFSQSGVRGMFHDGYGQDVEAYVTFRLMNDPSLNVEKLLDEYFSMYGPAAKPLKEFYNEVEKIYCNPDNYLYDPAKLQTEYYIWNYIGTKARMDKLEKIINRAEKAVEKSGTDIQKQRFKLFKLGIWEYMKAGRAKSIPPR